MATAHLLYLPGRHTAEAVRGAVVEAMKDLPARLRRSLTWDQGSEMALHAEIAAALGTAGVLVPEGQRSRHPWLRPPRRTDPTAPRGGAAPNGSSWPRAWPTRLPAVTRRRRIGDMARSVRRFEALRA